MDAKENKTGNDIPPVGEVIPLGSGDNVAATPNANEATPKDSDEGLIAIPRPRRRKRVRGANAEGTPAETRAESPRGEAPPRDTEGEKKERKSGDKEWRKKYGDHNGRELLCTTLAGYWDKVCVELANYIAESGGKPVLAIQDGDDDEPTRNQVQWAGLLVLAVDDILPPGLEASPALIAGAGTTTLLLQGAITARKNNNKRKPAEPSFKAETKSAPAASPVETAKDANPPDSPKPQAGTKRDKSDNVLRDKEGNRTV